MPHDAHNPIAKARASREKLKKADIKKPEMTIEEAQEAAKEAKRLVKESKQRLQEEIRKEQAQKRREKAEERQKLQLEELERKAKEADDRRRERIEFLKEDLSQEGSVGFKVRGDEMVALEELVLELSTLARTEFSHHRQVTLPRVLRALAATAGKRGGTSYNNIIKQMMKMSGDGQ